MKAIVESIEMMTITTISSARVNAFLIGEKAKELI